VAVFGRRESTQSQTIETMRLTKSEIRTAIPKHVNAKEVPGYDVITS